jgi:hypothetical protein
MKLQTNRCLFNFTLIAALFFSAVSVQADPIPFPAPNFIQEAPFIGIPIVLEAICVVLLLRCFQKPRNFILWVLGMHVLTYPLFFGVVMGLLFLSHNLYFRVFTRHLLFGFRSLELAEVLIILVEGSLIYLMCRYLSPKPATLPIPSTKRCMVVSLAGNVCSLLASGVLNVVIFDLLGVKNAC